MTRRIRFFIFFSNLISNYAPSPFFVRFGSFEIRFESYKNKRGAVKRANFYKSNRFEQDSNRVRTSLNCAYSAIMRAKQ